MGSSIYNYKYRNYRQIFLVLQISVTILLLLGARGLGAARIYGSDPTREEMQARDVGKLKKKKT